MKRHVCLPKHIDFLNKHRPPEYWTELAPALIETLPDGSRVYDADHEAWHAAVKKYRPAVKDHPKHIEESWSSRGPRLWGIFHAMTLAYDGDANRFVVRLNSFIAALGCGACKNHAIALLAKMPPVLDQGEEVCFAWGVDFHNAVSAHINEKLKPGETPKVMMGVEEAREIWHQGAGEILTANETNPAASTDSVASVITPAAE